MIYVTLRNVIFLQCYTFSSEFYACRLKMKAMFILFRARVNGSEGPLCCERKLMQEGGGDKGNEVAERIA